MPDRPFQDVARGAIPHRARSAGGFSLLELIVTIAIAGVLLALAVPSFRSLMGGSQMSATVNELVFALQSARSEAIKRAGAVTLCASTAPLAAEPVCGGTDYARGWIVYADENGDGTRTPSGVDDDGETLILQSGPRAGAFAFPQKGDGFAARVLFDDTGASVNPASGAPRRVEIDIDHAGGEASRTVVIAANGRIASGSR